MTINEAYYEYLKGRSNLGLCYRRYWLYPKLCRFVKGRTLDIGCGIGDFLSYRPGTIGVDINNATVEWCRRQGFDARMMLPDQLPFDKAEFDSVVLDNVLEHLTTPEPLLMEVYRVLRPQGIVVVGVPGQKGYDSDPDHKVYYDRECLVSTLLSARFNLKQLFCMPIQSAWLNSHMRQYCIYGIFQRD